MEQLTTVLSFATTSYFALPLLTAIVALALSYILLPRGNWHNAPPGPIGWPIVGYLPYLTDRLHNDLFRLAKTHGPIYSLKMGQKPAIVISSPEMAKQILKHQDATFSSHTITEAVRCMTYNAPSLVFLPYGTRWRLLRKILTTELFSSRTIDLLQPARKLQVHDLLKKLYSSYKTETPINLADSTFVVSLNLISNLVCSKSLFQETKEGREIKNTIWQILEVVGTPNIADLIPWLKVLDPQGLKRRVRGVVKTLDDFFEKLMDEKVDERKRGVQINANGMRDMLDVFLDYKSDNKDDELKQFSRDDMRGMLRDMFIAGTDTSSSTVEWGMTEILKNPEIYKKIMEELGRVVGMDRLVEENDITQLIFFQAAVKEVFRLHPAVPLLIPRHANEACEINGYKVPRECIVFVNVWGMGRDPTVWPEPLEFRPERFLGSNIDVKGQDFELLPFGSGRRYCIGMPLGLRMIQYSLASLLHAFDWSIPGDVLEDMTEKVGLTVQKARSLVCVPKPRLDAFHYIGS